MDKLVNLCKARGIIFPGSDIYGGMGNTWDYGPVGVELKNNVKRCWWKRFVQESENSYGLDAAILMNSKVWEASGHTASFSDPKMDCKECKSRHRADQLIEAHSHGTVNPDVMTNEEMEQYIEEHHVNCPICGKHNWTPIRQFNMMFETSRGVVEDAKDKIYLRPETAQGEYVNFLNVQRTTRAKVPFGIGQIGKAFRNEITPGNFIFRTIEFEQMEHQWFCKEGTDHEYYEKYKQNAEKFLLDLGIKEDHLRFKDHDKLAHYAKAACDIQYYFPIGWSELNGIHNRTNFDLTRHQEYSGKNMCYTDPVTNEKYIPFVIEYSIGADRLMLAVLSEAYDEETLDNGETRAIAQIPIATFVDANSLEALTGNIWIETTASGNATLRTAGEGGAGKISASSLEDSTVDIASEFTDMITTQRAYSAASKIITTADSMLEELLTIKR